MKIKRICIFKEFHCTGSQCQENCCRGWQVPLDAAICKKYRAEQKKLGPLFCFSVKKSEGIPMFRSIFGRCPHLGKGRLCKLQIKYGEEYMAQVCRQFPRRLYHLGFFCEETLYLACPEAAGLFWKHAEQGKAFVFEETEGEVSYEVGVTNDDEEFLDYLLTARGQLIGMLGETCHYDSLSILKYGQDAQQACLRGEHCVYPQVDRSAKGGRLEMDCAALNRLFFHGFYHPYLKIVSPFLHHLCWRYIVKIALLSSVNRKAAERRLALLRESIYQKIPNWDTVMDRYYEYYLQSEFLDIFEDYSFLRCLVFGMVKIQMLWVLIALYAQDRGEITEDEIARIIAVYERRAPQLRESLSVVVTDVMREIGEVHFDKQG